MRASEKDLPVTKCFKIAFFIQLFFQKLVSEWKLYVWSTLFLRTVFHFKLKQKKNTENGLFRATPHQLTIPLNKLPWSKYWYWKNVYFLYKNDKS